MWQSLNKVGCCYLGRYNNEIEREINEINNFVLRKINKI